MNLENVKKDLSETIASGLINKYTLVEKELSCEGVYAFILYCSSGFYAMDIAASTEESLSRVRKQLKESSDELLVTLEEHPDLYEIYSTRTNTEYYEEVSACEWEYLYVDIPEYENLDQVMREIYDYSYENSDEDFDVQDFIASAILDGIRSFKETVSFERGMFLGLQFCDPSLNEIDIVEMISKEVNKDKWHDKLVVALESMRQENS